MLEDLRPYYDCEVEAAVNEMASDQMLLVALRPVFSALSDGEIVELVKSQRTVDGFQRNVAIPMLQWVIDNTMNGFSWSGVENIDRSQGHLFISNHRDIVLDGSLLQYVLLNEGMPTSEVTFGSNLLYNKLVEHLAKLNKLFKIVRTNSGKEFLAMSRVLSEHLHEVVGEGRSIWIAQRNGRTKNGIDTTEPALVKMVAMAGGDIKTSLQSLNIQPFAISYEFESCDFAKARETFLTARDGNYTKQPGEDFNSIVTGIRQPKGRVHIAFAPAIRADEIEALTGSRNEIIAAFAELLDIRIRTSYKLFPNNYIAADMLNSPPVEGWHLPQTNDGVDINYTKEEQQRFKEYLAAQPFENDEMRHLFLEIYANSVK